ncbi:MAG: signal recognition particle receptor subunit alpha, partial [Alkalibacterium sp.]|nr:signal recognition particle receptor subunit alpha [Alkalibacterium sp.]
MGLFDKIKSAFTGAEAKDQPQVEVEEEVKEVVEDSAAKETTLEPDNTKKETDEYEKGLKKSRLSFTRRLNELLANFRYEDEEFFEELEDLLIESDVGFEATMQIADTLRYEAKVENVKSMKDAERVIVKTMVDMYGETNPDHQSFNENPDGLPVVLFVGVNGVGITTTIAKMARQYIDKGKKVVLAAGDTFRAGAIEQLNIWGGRVGAEVISTKQGGDPAAVVFDS